MRQEGVLLDRFELHDAQEDDINDEKVVGRDINRYP